MPRTKIINPALTPDARDFIGFHAMRSDKARVAKPDVLSENRMSPVDAWKMIKNARHLNGQAMLANAD